MYEDDSMPVSHVKNITLPLYNGHEKCCTEVIRIEKLGELSSPITQILRDALRFFRSTADRYRLN